jgi:beta-galactosidase
VGAAVPQDVWRRRLARLQSLGVNAIRTAHNPVDPEFLDTCDVMGILVMDEFFDCWTIAKRKYDYHLNFDEWSHRDLADTIRRDRNHPSIVLYSVGNEIHDTPKAELAKRILKGLVEVCHETDPTRPVTQGLFRPNVSHDYDNGLADLLDVIGTNYRDGELLQAWRDNPERKIVGTEQRHELSTWLNCRDYPQHAGQFLWVGIDYLGESPKWPVTCFNAGLLDRAGFVQPRGVQRQSWWSDVPMVAAFRRIARTPDAPVDPGYEVIEWDRRQVLFPDWNPHKESPGEQNVEVYSNCDSVELLLNGKSLGKKTRPEDDSPRNWKVAYEPGALVAVGSNGGTQVCRDQLRTAGEPAKLLLTADRETLPASWENVAHVEVTVADVDGVRSPRSDNLLEFQVEGPGKILAVDNGSVSSHESFQGAQRTAFHGRCLVILQATAEAGEITLTVSSEGLTPATVKIAAAGSL